MGKDTRCPGRVGVAAVTARVAPNQDLPATWPGLRTGQDDVRPECPAQRGHPMLNEVPIITDRKAAPLCPPAVG